MKDLRQFRASLSIKKINGLPYASTTLLFKKSNGQCSNDVAFQSNDTQLWPYPDCSVFYIVFILWVVTGANRAKVNPRNKLKKYPQIYASKKIPAKGCAPTEGESRPTILEDLPRESSWQHRGRGCRRTWACGAETPCATGHRPPQVPRRSPLSLGGVSSTQLHHVRYLHNYIMFNQTETEYCNFK